MFERGTSADCCASYAPCKEKLQIHGVGISCRSVRAGGKT